MTTSLKPFNKGLIDPYIVSFSNALRKLTTIVTTIQNAVNQITLVQNNKIVDNGYSINLIPDMSLGLTQQYNVSGTIQLHFPKLPANTTVGELIIYVIAGSTGSTITLNDNLHVGINDSGLILGANQCFKITISVRNATTAYVHTTRVV